MHKKFSILSLSGEYIKWLIFLKANNKYYRDVKINQQVLEMYEDDAVPDQLMESITYTNDDKGKDVAVEKGVNDDLNVFKRNFQTVGEMQHSLICEDDSGILNLEDVYEHVLDKLQDNKKEDNQAEEKLIAMICGNKLSNIKTEEFFYLSFPCLFPFGIGAPLSKRVTKVAFEDEIQHMLLMANNKFKYERTFSTLSRTISF